MRRTSYTHMSQPLLTTVLLWWSCSGGQRQQQQQQGRKRKVPEPTGSLQASAGTAFRPAVFSLQAGIPQGGNQSGGDDSSGEEDAPKKKRSRR